MSQQEVNSHSQERKEVLEKLNELLPESEVLPSGMYSNSQLVDIFGGKRLLDCVRKVFPVVRIVGRETRIALSKAAEDLMEDEDQLIVLRGATEGEELDRDREKENLPPVLRILVDSMVEYFKNEDGVLIQQFREVLSAMDRREIPEIRFLQTIPETRLLRVSSWRGRKMSFFEKMRRAKAWLLITSEENPKIGNPDKNRDEWSERLNKCLSESFLQTGNSGGEKVDAILGRFDNPGSPIFIPILKQYEVLSTTSES